MPQEVARDARVSSRTRGPVGGGSARGRLTAVTTGARSRYSVAGAGAGERRAAAAQGGASSREEMRRGREREGRGFFSTKGSGRRIKSSHIYLVSWLQSRSRTTPMEAVGKPMEANKEQ